MQRINSDVYSSVNLEEIPGIHVCKEKKKPRSFVNSRNMWKSRMELAEEYERHIKVLNGSLLFISFLLQPAYKQNEKVPGFLRARFTFWKECEHTAWDMSVFPFSQLILYSTLFVAHIGNSVTYICYAGGNFLWLHRWHPCVLTQRCSANPPSPGSVTSQGFDLASLWCPFTSAGYAFFPPFNRTTPN